MSSTGPLPSVASSSPHLTPRNLPTQSVCSRPARAQWGRRVRLESAVAVDGASEAQPGGPSPWPGLHSPTSNLGETVLCDAAARWVPEVPSPRNAADSLRAHNPVSLQPSPATRRAGTDQDPSRYVYGSLPSLNRSPSLKQPNPVAKTPLSYDGPGQFIGIETPFMLNRESGHGPCRPTCASQQQQQQQQPPPSSQHETVRYATERYGALYRAVWHGTVRQVRKDSHAKRKSHVIVMSAGPLQSAIAASRPSKGSPLIETMVISQGLGPPSTTMSGCGNQGKPRASRCYCTPGAGRAHGSHGICQHQHQRLHLAGRVQFGNCESSGRDDWPIAGRRAHDPPVSPPSAADPEKEALTDMIDHVKSCSRDTSRSPCTSQQQTPRRTTSPGWENLNLQQRGAVPPARRDWCNSTASARGSSSRGRRADDHRQRYWGGDSPALPFSLLKAAPLTDVAGGHMASRALAMTCLPFRARSGEETLETPTQTQTPTQNQNQSLEHQAASVDRANASKQTLIFFRNGGAIKVKHGPGPVGLFQLPARAASLPVPLARGFDNGSPADGAPHRPCRRLVFPPFSLSCLRSGWPSLNRLRSDIRLPIGNKRVVPALYHLCRRRGRTPGAPFVVPISRHITVQNHAVDTPPENCDLWRRPEETHRRNPSHGPALPPSGRSNGPTTTNPPSQNDAQSAPPSERRSHGPSVRRFLQRLPRFCSLLQGKDAIRGPRQGPPVPTKPCPALPAAPVAHDCGRSCLPGAFGGRGWPPVAGWPSTSVKLVRFVSSITRHSPANQRPAPVVNRSATE
ncbi:hypothetical protein Purlil1_5840 [Purpureocillium lilacinum]|uniref:Uncharacterized protein n=1 Tax=Purpureocillium lilacinum TaxID=33203 RepID=A0ABR0C0D2_PURLI|nr:hypothetical protein Purlil1_5840 [Purpureocillium lilacinum]